MTYVFTLLGYGNTNVVEIRDDVQRILDKGVNVTWIPIPIEQMEDTLQGKTIFAEFNTMLDTLVSLRFTSPTGEKYIHVSVEDYLLRYLQSWMAHKLSPWGENVRRNHQWSLDCGHFSRWYSNGIQDMRPG